MTSLAQLADCLTKGMDASVLRERLKTGKYTLFDEDLVLKTRADKRARLAWINKQASTETKQDTVQIVPGSSV